VQWDRLNTANSVCVTVYTCGGAGSMVNAAGAGAGDEHKAKKAAKAAVPFFSPAALQQGAQLVFVRRGAARRGAAEHRGDHKIIQCRG
jgi:hypothetical protein